MNEKRDPASSQAGPRPLARPRAAAAAHERPGGTMPGSDRELLERIFAEDPKFHAGEPEIRGEFRPTDDGILSPRQIEMLAKREPFSMAVDRDTADFVLRSIDERSRTLETGAGISTLVFAIRRASHVTVTPNESEHRAIRTYAEERGISIDKVAFVAEPSDRFLPRCDAAELDLVLIDGKHAFPWPIIDWFYTAEKLRVGGVVVLDDTHLPTVAILRDFLAEDRSWKAVFSSEKATAFRKLCPVIHDVAWYMQAFVATRWSMQSPPGFSTRLWRGVRRRIRRLIS